MQGGEEPVLQAAVASIPLVWDRFHVKAWESSSLPCVIVTKHQLIYFGTSMLGTVRSEMIFGRKLKRQSGFKASNRLSPFMARYLPHSSWPAGI